MPQQLRLWHCSLLIDQSENFRQGANVMKKVLLLSMPMGALERPSLGLSLLKARLVESGYACDVRYLAFSFAEFIGQQDYQWICYELPYTAFAGDWTFTQALYGERYDPDGTYIQDVLRDSWHLSKENIPRNLGIGSRVLISMTIFLKSF